MAKLEVDWEQAEKLFRAGNLSLSEIGARIGVSKVAIKKHMDKLGIKRDLTQAVRQEAKRQVAEQSVNDSVYGKHGKRRRALTDAEIVEAGGKLGAAVIDHHRRDIKAGREVCELLMGQLYEATSNIEQIEQAIHDETKDEAAAHRRQAMYRAVSLPSRAGVIRDLTSAMKNLQGLERVAFGLKDDDGDELPEYESRLKALANGG